MPTFEGLTLSELQALLPKLVKQIEVLAYNSGFVTAKRIYKKSTPAKTDRTMVGGELV